MDGEYEILSKKVKANQIFTDGNSISEWGVQFMRTKDGEIYGFTTPDGTVYLDPDHLNANTPIHEFGHLWNSFIKSNNKKLYDRGAAIVKRSKYWKEINDNPFYARLTEDEKIDEALAMAIGDKGEWLYNEKGFGRQLLTWLNQAWNWLRTKLGFENLGHFTDIAVKDLRGGKPLTQNGASVPAQSKAAAQGTVKYPEQSKYDFDVEGITEANAMEMRRIKTAAQANGTFMKAPNGKKTNLNERQWLQVRTESFKKWFGDWENDPKNASKVVDENGEPMVVWHGTRDKSGFTVFDKNKIGSGNDEGFQGRGFYFSGQKRVADQYRGMDGNIYDTFLNIREPYYMSYEESNELAEANSAEVSQEFTDGIVSEGYDGVFFNANLRDEFVALNPNQIKSAFENNGNFNEESDDIRFQSKNNLQNSENNRTFAPIFNMKVDENTVNVINDKGDIN
jgi:hypothetical protein